MPKLDTEIDTINKTVRPMGIIEAIQEERIRQATEEVTEQVTEKVMKESVQKLYKRGFEIEAIAEMLEVPLEFAKESVK